ncbi:GNAT family N-acetyltransferase [Chloroflexota bacterium]
MTEADIDSVMALGGDLISREDLLAFGLGAPFDVSYVAEAEGHIVGFTFSRIQYVGIPLVKICVIGGIVVEYEYRRHGIGNKLVEEIFKHCHNIGVDTVRSLVEDGDIYLKQFCGRLGFRHSTITNYDITLYRRS